MLFIFPIVVFLHADLLYADLASSANKKQIEPANQGCQLCPRSARCLPNGFLAAV